MSSSRAALLIEVHLHDRRYHGQPEWPPGPARLFQALVAGSASRGALAAEDVEALAWLERMRPPVIAAPRQHAGVSVKLFVPNNDLDARGGRLDEVASLRTPKMARPRLLDAHSVIVYAWLLSPDEPRLHAERVVRIAETIHQLGRGVDMAWARAAIVAEPDLEKRLAEFDGEVHRPLQGAGSPSNTLLCPATGSLASLTARHEAGRERFASFAEEGKKKTLFRQAPKARFQSIVYEAPPVRAMFDLKSSTDPTRFAPWPQREVVRFCEGVRDAAAEKLASALEGREAEVEQALVGRTPEGRRRLEATSRVRFIPLPSIGHAHVDPSIRRLLVEVPGACPLRADDVFWACSGLSLEDAILVHSSDPKMLDRHYAPPGGRRTWRTVTPVALPGRRDRARDARARQRAGSAHDRIDEEMTAVEELRQTLRHAGVFARITGVRVQREPWSGSGASAQSYAANTRFAKQRLWHVELELDRRVCGPLILGDGRFLGLGLMAPLREDPRVVSFRVSRGWTDEATPLEVANALRRAVVARCQREFGRAVLPVLVTGHEANGDPARGHHHLSFVCDPRDRVLHVVFPASARSAEVERVVRALEGFGELRAGRSGLLDLQPLRIDLVETSRTWRTVTPYVVRRHLDLGSAATAIAEDAAGACMSLGLPRPEVTVDPSTISASGALEAQLVLRFAAPVRGPLLLGRTAHKGGGFCRPVASEPAR